jgi:hypothetical protein
MFDVKLKYINNVIHISPLKFEQMERTVCEGVDHFFKEISVCLFLF